jgi:hypothetical protein
MTLFQTHAWQSAWWETWGEENGLKLARVWGDGSTGIYTSAHRVNGLIPVRSLEFVGSSHRKFRSTRTEYNRFSSLDDTPEVAIRRLKTLMNDCTWGEAIFNDLQAGSEEVAELLTLAHNNRWLVRETDCDTAWQVRTDGAFNDYLKALGRNSRLRLYNRRSVLEALGAISQENVYDQSRDPSEFFSHLNEFHQRRWGKPVYGAKALAFNAAFLERVVSEGGEPQLLALRCDDQLISVLYNVKYQGRIYNFQSGFEERMHPKVAVGTLHLGYAIERAFLEEDAHSFDMLAGSGKNENYKRCFATDSVPLISLMLVRHPVLKRLYRLKDRR